MSQTENKFKSTTIYGKFKNVDSTDGTILADVNFKRNLTVQNDLIIGNEILDSSNNVVSTNGSIIFTINKIIYTLPILTLSYLNSITSNVQTQINTINTTIQNLLSTTTSNIITFSVSLNGMTTTTFNYLKNVTSDVQTQINNVYSGNNSFVGQNIFTNNTTFWNKITLTNTGNTFLNSGNSVLNNITFSGTLNTISTTTFNYLSGVTSNIQTQLNNIVSSISSIFTQTNIFTGANTFKNAITFGDSTLNNSVFNAYCSTFNVQGCIGNFNNGLNINSGDMTVVSGNIIFNNSIGGISKTVFNYLSGVTSNIQTQFNNILTSITVLNTQVNTLSNSMITSSGNQDISGNKNFTGYTTFNNIQYNYNSQNLFNASTVTNNSLCWYKIGQITMPTSISGQKCSISLFGGDDIYQGPGSGNYQIYFTTIQNSNNIEIDGYFYGLTINQYLKNVIINSSTDLKTFTIYVQLAYNTKFYFDTTVSGLNLSFTQSFSSYGINAPIGFYLLKSFYVDGVFQISNLSIGSFNTNDVAISNFNLNGGIYFLNTVSCTGDLWANGYNTGDRFTTIENNVNRLNDYFYCDDNYNIDINTKHATGLTIGTNNQESIIINNSSNTQIRSYTGIDTATLTIKDSSSENSIIFIPNVGFQSYNGVFRQGSAIATLNNSSLSLGLHTNNTGIVIDQNDLLINCNSNYLYLNGSGIGINKTNPTYPLDVNGQIKCSDFITSSISSLNTTISTINTNLDNLSNTDTSHTNSINSLNTSITNLTNSINGLILSVSILQNSCVKAYGYWSGSLGSNSLTTNYKVDSAFFNTQFNQTGVQMVLSSSISNLKSNISVTCDSDGNNATAHILSYNPFTFIVACYGGSGNAQLVNGVRNTSFFFTVI